MPRPIIQGTVIRQIDMRCSLNGSNKDYRITITQDSTSLGCRVYTEHGPADSLRQGKELPGFPFSENGAHHSAEEIRNRKQSQRDRYTVMSDQTFRLPAGRTPVPPAAAPERRLRRSTDTLSASSRAKLASMF